MPDDILAQIEADGSALVARTFLALATDYLAETIDRQAPVSTRATPNELAALFAEPIPRAGIPAEVVLRRLREEVIPNCNHLAHPRYVGHQVSASLPIGAWVEPLTAVINNSLAVFEMSPVGTVLETQVVRWMCDLAGFGAAAGGTLTTGGSEATLTAMLAARAAALPDAWTAGIGADPPLLLCGEHAHYAVTRAAGELGIGMRNVRIIRSVGFRMDPDALRGELERADRQGRAVMAVVATAGSTPTGTFDDLEAIGAVCAERDTWLHVDGAHGASALLSARHRHRLRGIERARSLAWDPHKLMLLPVQAGMLLMRDERDLQSAFAQQAPYLFRDAHDERERSGGWDQGVRSFLCSRRADVLKLWVALQRYGIEGFGALYDHLCDVTRTAFDAVGDHPGLEALHEPECNILCFRYVGGCSRDDPRLDGLNGKLRERYNASGAGWITGTNLGSRRVLRMTIQNPRTTTDDVLAVLNGVSTLGRALEAGTA